jgi:UDP-2,3-diacylglucosamine pyrophosphatase LpxH
MRFSATIVVVSDLHMAAGERDPFQRDEEFAAFVEAQRERRDAAGRPVRLLVLGDLFDFPATPDHDGGWPDGCEAGALRRLERIAAAHERVLEALASFAAAAGPIDVIAGNHDAELVHPRVRARLRELLGGPETLVFHPWFMHVPGVLYAEHGHQHHDINAFTTPLTPWRPDAPGELDLPPGSLLAYREGTEGAAPGLRGRVARGTTLVRGAGRRRGDPALLQAYRDGPLRRFAADVGLDHALVCAIDAATPRGPVALAARLARRATSDGRRPASSAYRAALRVHRALDAAGGAVASYVFGHSHVAERRPLLQGARAPLYLNAGTWSTLRRGPWAEHPAYVEIAGGSSGPIARLVHWTPEGARAVTGDGRWRRPQDADRLETAIAPR